MVIFLPLDQSSKPQSFTLSWVRIDCRRRALDGHAQGRWAAFSPKDGPLEVSIDSDVDPRVSGFS